MRKTFFLILAASAFGSFTIQSAAPKFIARTIAGTGTRGYSGDGGQAIHAQINNPYGLLHGRDGTVYFCDMSNHAIRKIDPNGIISTVAGSGKPGYSGDGGPARDARLNEPYELRLDSHGNIFFVEMQNHLIRRVDAKTQKVSTVAGLGQPGFAGDGGPATHALLKQPHSLQLDSEGNIFICDIGNHRLRSIEAKSGIIRTIGGTGAPLPTPDGAPLEGTPLKGPRAIDFDRLGNLWLALREGNSIYKIDLYAGRIYHQAGTGQTGFSGHGGPAKQATLSGPKGVSVGSDGHVYFAYTESHTIRKVNLATQTMELVCGTGQKGDGPDGDSLNCKLSRPHGIFADPDGSIWVGDSENHRIRHIGVGRITP